MCIYTYIKFICLEIIYVCTHIYIYTYIYTYTLDVVLILATLNVNALSFIFTSLKNSKIFHKSNKTQFH